jgi:hypothetical protein
MSVIALSSSAVSNPAIDVTRTLVPAEGFVVGAGVGVGVAGLEEGAVDVKSELAA